MKGNCGECDRRWFCEIDPDTCDEWPDPVPATNGDRIRALPDEELSDMLVTGRGGFDCSVCKIGDCRKCDMDCKTHCLEWLKSPAEEKPT